MKKFVIFILGLFSASTSFAVTLEQFGEICRNGDPGVASAWIYSDAATVIASLLFNPNSEVDIGNCHRSSMTTETEGRSEGTECEFSHTGEIFSVKIQIPPIIKAKIILASGTQILSYSNAYVPTFTTSNSKGEPLNIPGGPLVASCDIGSNDSYLLFEDGTVWELDQPRHL